MIRPFGDGRDRYFTERLGMFIHWGLYAIPAWHEQILWRTDMKRREYEQLVPRLQPGSVRSRTSGWSQPRAPA